VTIVTKDKDTTSESMRINLIHESGGTICAIDQPLIVEIHNVVAQGGRTDAGEDIAANVLQNVLEVANGNFRDGGGEWVE
jgi:hypothetical protein